MLDPETRIKLQIDILEIITAEENSNDPDTKEIFDGLKTRINGYFSLVERGIIEL